jgi:hypothetical protein
LPESPHGSRRCVVVGRRGPLPKPPDRAQGHRSHPHLAPVVDLPTKPRSVPKAPAGVRDKTKREWGKFWRSPIGQLIDLDIHLPTVRRLFQLRDQFDRAEEVVRQAPVVKGSVGQVRVNPLADYMLKLETAIVRLEVEFGQTLSSQYRLGLDALDLAGKKHSLDQLVQRSYGADILDEDDPRATGEQRQEPKRKAIEAKGTRAPADAGAVRVPVHRGKPRPRGG